MPALGGGGSGWPGSSGGSGGTALVSSVGASVPSNAAPLSFAGVPLGTPSLGLAAWIQRRMPIEWLNDFGQRSWPGKNLTGIAWPGLSRPSPITLNTLHWPIGASRWATFYAVVDDTVLNLIKAQVYAGSNSNKYQSQPLVMTEYDQSGNQVHSLSTSMWMLPPRPLTQVPGPLASPLLNTPSPAQNRLWLLTLVDDRYFWWLKALGNVSITENTTTWSNLFSTLATALGVTITVDTVNAAYLKPSAALAYQYEAIPPLLDAVAYNCGQRVVRWLDGTVRTLNASTSAQQAFANFSAWYGYRCGGGTLAAASGQPNDLVAMVPATVAHCFSALGQSSSYVVTSTLSTLIPSGFEGVVGYPGTKVFHDVALASYVSGSPSNSSELTTLANQFASDWWTWQAGNLDLRMSGVIPWNYGAQSDFVEWSMLPGNVSTLVRRMPWNDLAEELQHASSKGSALPAKGGAWVSVSTTSVSSGTQAGNLVDYGSVEDATKTYDAIKVKQLNGYVLKTGKFYRAFYVGPDASGNPVYATTEIAGIDATAVPWIGCASGTPTTETLVFKDGVLDSAT